MSAELAGGAHPYFVPVEHTSLAREQLGAGPLLAPEQMVVLESDPARARQTARLGMQLYLGLSNYTKNLHQFGFGDDDFNNGRSDRLVDAIVAGGEPESMAAAIRAHHDAGADRVCVQVLSDRDDSVPRQGWRQLAEALGQFHG